MNERLERIEIDGTFIGTLVREVPMVRVFRAVFKPSARPVYRACVPMGTITEFTFPSRKQAIEWLTGAAKELDKSTARR